MYPTFLRIGSPAQSVTDPNWANVVLLMDGSSTSADLSSANNTMSPSIGCTVSSAQSKFGPTSLLFDGTFQGYTSRSNTSTFRAQGDFTAEAHIRVDSVGSTRYLFGQRSHTTGDGWDFVVSAAGALYVQCTASAVISANGLISANTWYHVAWSRSGSTVKVFIDGVEVATGTPTIGNETSAAFYVGMQDNNLFSFPGYMSNIRLTNGVARYTADFTPPNGAYPTRG